MNGMTERGTLMVRMVVQVEVDPKAWVTDVMEEHPDEVLQGEVRRDVRRRAGTVLRDKLWADKLPVGNVEVEGVRLALPE